MDFRPNVERGMAWLDANRPGWERRINLARLDLNSPCNCLLGQEYDLEAKEAFRVGREDRNGYRICNGYDIGFDLLLKQNGIDDYFLGIPVAHSLGFATRHDADYPALTETWRKAIKERLAALDIPHDELEQQPAKAELATAS